MAVAKKMSVNFKSLFNKDSGSSNGGHRSGLSVNSLSKISDQLTNIAQGKNIQRTAFILCFVSSAWFIADIFALLFEKYLPTAPVSPLAMRSRSSMTDNPSQYEDIASRNLFSSKPPKKSGNEIDLEAEPVPTSLPLQLIGTVIFKDPSRSLAAIQDKNDNKVYPVRMNDEIDGKIQVLSVDAHMVVFINLQARRKEYIDIPQDNTARISMSPRTASRAANTGGNITQVEENKFVVKRAEIESQMANFNALITQARAVPEMQGGEMVGFRLMQIQPGSFYEKIGLKVGDIITSSSGQKITDVNKAFEMLKDLKHMNSLDLGIMRNGKEVNLNYDIQ
jgi:general secretion pathway protein C